MSSFRPETNAIAALPDAPRPGLTLVVLTAVVLLAATAGCGPDYPKTVPVEGRVTYGGGPWPLEGTILFLPEEPAPGHTYHPGMADFDVEGRFEVGTFQGDDGLVPGAYVVQIECWKVPPTMDGPPAESYIPPAYQNGRESLPKLVVEPDDRKARWEFDVPKP